MYYITCISYLSCTTRTTWFPVCQNLFRFDMHVRPTIRCPNQA